MSEGSPIPRTVRLALAGDTMLGRGVAEALAVEDPRSLVAPELAELMRDADVTLVNLECCVSERGEPNRLPGKPFFFRAPPAACDLLGHLGVDCVSVANNHALDFGEVALLDTFRHLSGAGIDCVGAGPDLDRARAPVRVTVDGVRLAVVGFTDHPGAFAATPDRPGVAHVDLRSGDGIAPWMTAPAGPDTILVVTPHLGPNMLAEPLPEVRAAAARLVDAGATLVAGHSAHVFQGVQRPVLYDLGDFLDDYAVDADLRNDLGLLFLVDVDAAGPRRLEAVPLRLDYCRTGPAEGDDARWIARRFRRACRAFGEDVTEEDGRLVLTWG